MAVVLLPNVLAAGMKCPLERAELWVRPLSAAMLLYDIKTPRRATHFLAQVGHESGGLRYVKEIWGPTRAQRGYEGRKDLGNTHPGDGKRFLGRGPIGITGRYNARMFTRRIRLLIPTAPDFEQRPELLELPVWGSLAAADFWKEHNLNEIADTQDIVAVTKVVNGGTNGLASRRAYYARFADLLIT